MSPLETIDGQEQPQEQPVVDSTGDDASFTIISLSSASPANSDLHCPIVPPPPMNTPAKSSFGTSGGELVKPRPSNPVNNTASLDQLFSCFYPFNRLWPFNWSGSRKEAIFPPSDSDVENYEIGMDSIDVNFKENYIGGGTQSSVFWGKWRGHPVALKKLNRTTAVDISDIKRLCNLNNPHVIKTFGVSTKEVYPCIVMEYCEKGGLFDYLRRTPSISKSYFIRWSVEVATGMAYLHSLKIVHRDLKSPNILVDNRDALKICDFGSLYAWDQRLNSQNQAVAHHQMASVVMSVCGTSQWMSPEMMKNEPCNEKVDVWSYGVVLWELLTGEVPYEKIAPMAVCFGVGSDRLRLHVPKTAPDNVKFLLKLCWAKRPRNRPGFISILSNLNNLQAELADIQEDGWAMRRELWRREISEENAKLMVHNSGPGVSNFNAQKQKEEELIQKRMHELRHAQEIRQLYDMKLKKVDKIMRKVNRFLQQMEAQNLENERAAAEMNDRCAHNAHWHQVLHELHAALADLRNEVKQRQQHITVANGNTIAELNHIILQAEEARKAATFVHRGNTETRFDQHLLNAVPANKPQTQLHQKEQVVQTNNSLIGRPAILRMTYYNYDENGRKMDIQQRVIPTTECICTQFPKNSTVHERETNREQNRCRHHSSSSTNFDEEDEMETEYAQQKQQQRFSMITKKKLQTSASGETNTLLQQQQQGSQMSSCPSECSSLANVPSSSTCSGLFSRTSSYCRHSSSADVIQIQSPITASSFTQQQNHCQEMTTTAENTPASKFACVHTSVSMLSRDDSAISSTILPFSPSDCSLQNLINNNTINTSRTSSGHIHQQHHYQKLSNASPLCSNCKCNLALPLSVQQQFFARNSVTRASGLSADSGVCQEDDSLPIVTASSPLCGVLEENGNFLIADPAGSVTCCLAPNTCQCPQKALLISHQQRRRAGRRLSEQGGNVNQQRRGRIRRPASQIPFDRQSPLRTPSRQTAANEHNSRRCRSGTVLRGNANFDINDNDNVNNNSQLYDNDNNIVPETMMHMYMQSQQHPCDYGIQTSDTTNTQIDNSMANNPQISSSHCSSSSSATLGRIQQHQMQSPTKSSNSQMATPQKIVISQKPTNRRLLELHQQYSHESCNANQWSSSPELHQLPIPIISNNNNNTEEESAEESSAANAMCSYLHETADEVQTIMLKLGPIDEMTDSQLTKRAVAAEKAAMASVMLESSSTMVSSLERSLEMAVANSDGLSDRETKLKEAKTTFKLTHRRTASNPTSLNRCYVPTLHQQQTAPRPEGQHASFSSSGSSSSASADKNNNDNAEEVQQQDGQQHNIRMQMHEQRPMGQKFCQHDYDDDEEEESSSDTGDDDQE